MDQSLRNHAMLVQHQNEQQQQQRQQRRAEEYYRNNHGMQIPPGGSGGGSGVVLRGSSSSQASGSNKSSNKSSRGSNSVSSGSKQSRTSGSGGSGKSTRSGTRNSGTAGSDDAIGGGGGLGASLAAHHNRDHRQHRQQQQQSHRQQQQQQQYQQQQHGMTPQQYRQQLGTVPQHQQYQEQYQQQEQHYNNNNSQPQQEQYLQEQYLQQQYEQQQQQQHEQQQQYELQQQYEQQQLQQQYEQQQQQESQHYHGSYSSQISQSQYSQSQYSQQSQSQQSYYIDYQSQGGGGGGQAGGGTVQSHYSSIYGSVTGGASQAQQSQAQQSQAQQSQASTARSAAVDEAYRRLGQKLSRSVHGDDISLASSARGQPHNRIPQQAQQQQQHPVRIGSVNNPSSVFVPYNKGAAVEQQEKEQRQKQQRATSEDDNGTGNVVRKLTANANDLFRLWHTEYQRTNPNKNTSNVKEQQQHQRRQPNQKQNHDRDHDVSPDRRGFAQMTLAGDGSSSSSNNNNNNTIGDAHNNNNNNNNSSHHHISSHNHSHNHNNHNSIYHQRRGSLSAVIESDSCTNKRSSSDSSNGRSRATNNTNINQRSTQSVGDGGRGENDNSIIASSSIGTRASSIGTRTCNSSRSHNALPPPRGKCLTQPSEGVSGTNYNLCDNTEGNLIVYKNDTLSVPRKQVHVLNNETNSNGGDDGSKIRQSGSGASAYTDFRVRSLLGQGTFAQVFKCLNSQTGKYVAVKIVKAKPAYTRQAAIEIDVIRALTTSSSGNDGSSSNTDYMVDMVCYFMYKDHLCLVFELLGMNLYEVLKKRQFRGLPLGVVQTMVRQAVLGARALGQKSIVHCDLKPENILLVSDDDAESVMSAGESKRTAIQVEETGKSAAATTITGNSDGNDDASLSTITTTVMADQKIKLIDFGSACFEGQMSHTYIQSRFYRSPEVLIGLAYDSAIDMWSLGCVAAELFLGLPILPGVHEHNQLGRISEMIGDTPDWMLDQGSKTSKFFVKFVPAPTPTPTPPAPSATNPRSPSPIPPESRPGSQPPRPLPQWRIKTQQEYIASLSQKDIKKKGGLTKLEKQPGNRYFKRTRLSDIVLDKGQNGKQEDVRLLQYFVHFLYGILDPDPWKRWTASQVVNHPFLTGATMEANTGPIKDDNQANIILNLYWEAPSDPTIYRRKLLNVQKTREKQQAARRGQHRSYSRNRSRSESPYSQDGLPTVRSVSSETLSVSSYSDEFTNQAAAGPQMRPGSYQMSTSMTQFENNQGVRLAGYNSAAAGTQSIMYGPQSYSEAGNSDNLPRSFAEVDFALALQRPGVVPTGPGDSVTTSSMTASTSATTMSSNNSRSTYHHTNLGSQSGSYGTHQVLHNGNHQQRRFPVATSRSFGEGDVAATSRVPAEIDSHHQQVVYASSHDSGIYIGPPPTELKAENIPNNLPLAMSTPPAPPAALGSTTQLPMQYTVPLNNSSAAVTSNNTGIQNPNMGNYDQQAYQQQLAMMQHQFQQQQILLQQQQAALALQQQQLEQYSMNQALMNPNIPNAAAAGMNTGGAPAAVQGGGYYVVTADDGTSRLVAASNLGMAIPMSGQVAGIGVPGQIQGQGITTPNNQTTGDGFYTNNSNHQHQHPHQQP